MAGSGEENMGHANVWNGDRGSDSGKLQGNNPILNISGNILAAYEEDVSMNLGDPKRKRANHVNGPENVEAQQKEGTLTRGGDPKYEISAGYVDQARQTP